MTVKLAERPARESGDSRKSEGGPAAPAVRKVDDDPLGIAVKDLDQSSAARLEIPKAFHGALVTKVEPLGPSFDAGVEKNALILEVNRKPVESASEYRKIVKASHPGTSWPSICIIPTSTSGVWSPFASIASDRHH